MGNEKSTNERSTKVRVMSGLTALGILVGGYVVSSPVNAQAKSKYGVTIDEETQKEYNTVTVEQGDTASILSSRVVHYFIEHKEVPADDLVQYNEDYDTRGKFWPVIVYLNTKEGQAYHSRVGANFKFPKTYEELVALNNALRQSGWLARYVQSNNTYPKKRNHRVPREKTRRYIEAIYRECLEDPTFVLSDEMFEAYLKSHGYDGKFVIDDRSRLSQKEKEILTGWIPSFDELEGYIPEKPHGKTPKH